MTSLDWDPKRNQCLWNRAGAPEFDNPLRGMAVPETEALPFPISLMACLHLFRLCGLAPQSRVSESAKEWTFCLSLSSSTNSMDQRARLFSSRPGRRAFKKNSDTILETTAFGINVLKDISDATNMPVLKAVVGIVARIVDTTQVHFLNLRL